MPIVTKISSQKKSGRANIFLDGKFAFGIDLDNLVKFGLKVEQELTDAQVAKIVKEAEFAKTLGKLLNFATVRLRSSKEVADWFRRKEVHESLHSKLLGKLAKYDLLDDVKFAEWWVGQRLAFKHKSRKELVFELRRKGLDKAIIDSVLESSDIDDVAAARAQLATRAYKWQRLEPALRKQKQSEYLARKGFGWDTIKQVV